MIKLHVRADHMFVIFVIFVIFVHCGSRIETLSNINKLKIKKDFRMRYICNTVEEIKYLYKK